MIILISKNCKKLYYIILNVDQTYYPFFVLISILAYQLMIINKILIL